MNGHRRILIAGATGYLGSRLATQLLERGHDVVAFTRPGSVDRVPPCCDIVTGDACDPEAYAEAAQTCDTLIHLVGVAHPSPSKAKAFETVDLASARAAAYAAHRADVRHVLYVSVANPAPMMHAYVAARLKAEAAFRAVNIPLSVFRPWYVVGPGHYWPLLLKPIYRCAESLPGMRADAQRLGLLSLDEMLEAMLHAVDNPPRVTRVWDAPAIRDYRYRGSIRPETYSALGGC